MAERRYREPPRSAAQADAREVRARHDDSRLAMQEVAARLGHVGLAVHETRNSRRWFATCDCGWVSATSVTEKDATGRAIHHVKLAMKAWRLTGAGLPKVAPRVIRPDAEMRRRHPHYNAIRQAMEEAGQGRPGACPEESAAPAARHSDSVGVIG